MVSRANVTLGIESQGFSAACGLPPLSSAIAQDVVDAAAVEAGQQAADQAVAGHPAPPALLPRLVGGNTPPVTFAPTQRPTDLVITLSRLTC